MRFLYIIVALLLSLPTQAAESFSATEQFPDDTTFVVDASVAYEVTQLNIPEHALKLSFYFETNAGRLSFDQTLTDGTSVLTATTGIPIPADQWVDVDVGGGDRSGTKVGKIYVASATVSTRVYVMSLGKSEK